MLVDGDLNQALAAEPGFHGPTPGTVQVALIGVIHSVEGTLRAGAVHAKMVCRFRWFYCGLRRMRVLATTKNGSMAQKFSRKGHGRAR